MCLVFLCVAECDCQGHGLRTMVRRACDVTVKIEKTPLNRMASVASVASVAGAATSESADTATPHSADTSGGGPPRILPPSSLSTYLLPYLPPSLCLSGCLAV